MFQTPQMVFRAVEQRFDRRRVLVVGDLMLDAYLWGTAGRISPEAPVPVVRLQRRTATAGGSGNVLRNLVGLGLQAVAVGVVGDDSAGQSLRTLLAEAGVETQGVITVDGRPTTAKTRVVCGTHQMLRLDEEETEPLPEKVVAWLIEEVKAELEKGVAAIILSDYAKGVLTEEVCRFAIGEASRRGVPTLVDPKGRSFAKYAGASVLTPNLSEFERAVGLEEDSSAEFLQAGLRLRRELRLDFLVVTCGDQGIKYFGENGLIHHPALAREVYDVSGAGDTVIATLTAALSAGLDLDHAIPLANLAAGVVVGKVGTTPIQHHELLDAVIHAAISRRSRKICDLDVLKQRIHEWQTQGERVVFTNGCFDLLHVGHVTLLAEARRAGDRLVVGLNTDRSVQALKGPTRPVAGQDDRAQVLAGLASVDAVVLFDEETPLQLIEAIRPDVLVKGGDYVESEIVGAPEVRSWGGEVVIIPLVEGRSTTKILAQRQARGEEQAG